MNIVKVYNNNIVLAKNGNDEVIAIGSGIGYHKKINDPLEEAKIEKVYRFESKQQNQLHQLMDRVPVIYFRISEVIATKAMKQLNVELNSQILISLSDHICYAVERKKRGYDVPNFMLNEIKVLYEAEFKIGLWALRLIKANLDMDLGEDEAGYIAMHIVNATTNLSSNHSNISKILRFIKEAQRIVEDEFQVELKENDLNYSRFITHLKFLGRHMFAHDEHRKENLDELYTFFVKQDQKLEDCVNQIEEYVREQFHYTLEQYEKVYLMIHISKVVH